MAHGQRTQMRGAELDLLRQIRSRVSGGAGVALGIGDDCALLRPRAGQEIAVTTDLSIDGRHFRVGWYSPEAVGHRTLARGLSDLAAMGARPLAAFVSLGLPKDLVKSARTGKSWVSRFYDGLLALAEAHKTPVAGGDMAESPVALADIVLVGAVPRGRALLRSGARPGDGIYVTGALGGSAAGLAKLAELGGAARRVPARWAAMLQPHLYPQPRLAQGEWLRRRGIAAAAIDLSDGLSTDLAHICEESGVAAEVDAAAIPLGLGATLDQALHGGEDYELLFTARAGKRVPARVAGVAITRIGRVVRRQRNRPQVALIGDVATQPLEERGWQHFI
ncbi:thiamine-phosphate kinase [Occallatibacter riparius]|uniref:Thiamine-monophosphate kinase n=1 Tax=Occallatibacter riparius TaxID=1002689 RepID=A0A9J7BY87_9BACT|nr:thiamine-phosphate kinase [Occallatibacter riparius]UWZ86150.1 thiamine-phosphate kinase [Occallatibacter riparius]